MVDSIQANNSLRGSAVEVAKYMQDKPEFSDTLTSDTSERKWGSFSSALSNMYNKSVKTSESSGFNFGMISSSNDVPEYTSRKSRPSFLDSLNVPRASSGTSFQQTEPEKGAFISTSVHLANNDVQSSLNVQNQSAETETNSNISSAPKSFDYSGSSLVSASNGGDLLQPGFSGNNMEKKHDFYSGKQNEDFAALEQVSTSWGAYTGFADMVLFFLIFSVKC